MLEGIFFVCNFSRIAARNQGTKGQVLYQLIGHQHQDASCVQSIARSRSDDAFHLNRLRFNQKGLALVRQDHKSGCCRASLVTIRAQPTHMVEMEGRIYPDISRSEKVFLGHWQRHTDLQDLSAIGK